MKRHYLSGAAAIALAFGVTAAGAQNDDQRWQDPQKNQAVQDPQKSETTAAQQGASNQQGTQNPQEQGPQQNALTNALTNVPGSTGQQGGDNGVENEQRSVGRIVVGERDQTRIGDFIRQQRIQPVTNINFSLSVASTVPPSVRLTKVSGDLADVFPNYRDFKFFVAKQELVIVDPESFAIVAFVPISAGETVGAAPPRERTRTTATAEPPAPNNTAEPPAPSAPSKKRATRTEKKATTEGKPWIAERETTRRRPAHSETDVTVGVSPRGPDEVDVPAPRDRVLDRSLDRPLDRPLGPPAGLPMRERVERDQGPPPHQGVPFPFSLFFGQ